MDYRVHEGRLQKLAARFNIMVLLVFILGGTNAILGLVLYTVLGEQRVEITPFFGQGSYVNSPKAVDPNYLNMMAENFIYARFNITPENIDMGHQSILSFVDSRAYAALQKVLMQERNLVKEQQISSYFDKRGIQPNLAKLAVRIQGNLHRFVGLRELPVEPCSYIFQFAYRNGRLSIIRFVKEPHHA